MRPETGYAIGNYGAWEKQPESGGQAKSSGFLRAGKLCRRGVCKRWCDAVLRPTCICCCERFVTSVVVQQR